MQKSQKQKIVIVGCGNLAWHLAKQLSGLKKFDLFVYNHKENKLLNDFKTKFTCVIKTDLKNIVQDADYYFICVSDKSITSVSKKLKPNNSNALVMHTSGSKSISELGKGIKNKAVLYPLQTFSKSDSINWAEVPIAVEANSSNNLQRIKKLAALFSINVLSINSNERLKLHLSAVFVNNFTNALYNAADNFIATNINNKAVNFNILLPIIKQSANKLNTLSPAKAQTGPAKRNDTEVMKQHLKLLKNEKTLKKIYKQLSTLIVQQQKV